MSFTVHGLAVSRGIAIGRAVVVASSRIDVAHYIKLSQLAEKEGYFSLKMKMEEQAADEDGHANELKRLLN